MSEEEARAFIAKYDKNGDGQLDIGEFVDAMVALARPAPLPPEAADGTATATLGGEGSSSTVVHSARAVAYRHGCSATGSDIDMRTALRMG